KFTGDRADTFSWAPRSRCRSAVRTRTCGGLPHSTRYRLSACASSCGDPSMRSDAWGACTAGMLRWPPVRDCHGSPVMNQSLIKFATYLQLFVAIFMASGCATTQPFFANESPDLQHYLGAATRVEYPDVATESLAETTEAL